MKHTSDLCNLFIQISTKLKSCFKSNENISRYHILKAIPYRRVTSKNTYGKEEIFDLYQLGIFSSASGVNLLASAGRGQETLENLELVELQPQAEYRPHYHKNSSAVIYIILGSGTFMLGEKNIEYNANKRIVIPAGVVHGFHTQTRTLFLSIQSPPILNPKSEHIDIYYEKESNYE
ncbi:cupin domain-containing protein [Candidatus Paracaedibacter symbiosus]|uniref:cupin domain-containing protein n=1 Tax=Candidatus Paracaedibacter symbiosus TaxID=244582 RepID=UPI0005096F70|nr:cupin domain-containing protein [Candidatus Paracaedibacter symbiosus]